jgi:hypothetical protein
MQLIHCYHTIGRYLALPTGTIRAGQNCPYFANYMQRENMDPANMTPYLLVCYFQTYSGDDCHASFNVTPARTRDYIALGASAIWARKFPRIITPGRG